MSARIRRKDWSKTPLGPPESWPQSLKTSLGLLLHSGFPGTLYWGTDFICFYNDAYKNSLREQSRHPGMLGAAAAGIWKESWPPLKSMFDTVMQGRSLWIENAPTHFFNTAQNPGFGDFNFAPVIGETGRPAGIFITCCDTEDEIKVRQGRADDEEQLNFLLDSARLGTIDLNPQTGIAKVNRWTKEWYGLQEEDKVNFKAAMRVVVPKDRDRAEACFHNAILKETQGKYEIIYRIKNAPNARTRIVRAKGKAFFSDGPVAYRFQVTIEDITAEMNAHRSLRDSEEKFRKLMDNSLVATVIFTGKDYLITSPNQQMLALWNKTAAEVVGRPCCEAVSREFGDSAHELLDTVYKTGERLIINEKRAHVVRAGKRETIYLNLTMEPITDDLGQVSAILAMASEVTDKVNLQKVINDRNDDLKRERLKASVEAQEKEREVIANELHDNVNQLLASTKLYIGMIESKDERSREFAHTCSDYIEQCMVEIRNISHGLNPATLHFIGLSRAIRDMLEPVNEAGKIKFRFSERRNSKVADHHRDVELAIFRITQIQVANILKHSHAKSAKVSVLYCHDFVELSIADDGVGFDMVKARKGLGLLNILNRAELLQGTVSLQSEPTQGCLIKVRIPWSTKRQPVAQDMNLYVE